MIIPHAGNTNKAAAPARRADDDLRDCPGKWLSFTSSRLFWRPAGWFPIKSWTSQHPHASQPWPMAPAVPVPWTEARFSWFIIRGQVTNATLALGRRKSQCNPQILLSTPPKLPCHETSIDSAPQRATVRRTCIKRLKLKFHYFLTQISSVS